MPLKSKSRGIVFLLPIALAFILACTASLGPASSTPSAFDPTKAALEFQNTAIALQLTQAAPKPAQSSPIPPASTNTPPPIPVSATETPASQVSPEIQQLVERYYNKGYLPSTKGEYHPLEDFSKDWAQINNYDLYETGYSPENFMVTAHFEWQSAIRYPDPSGCGFGFHRQGDDHYLFFVDSETVWLGTWDDSANRFTRIGPTNGDNWVGLGNPGKGDVALIVNQKKAYAVVNNDFRGSYTLDTDWLIGSGELDYTVVSGTNKDYGTRCTMTNVHLWIFEP